MSDDGPGAESLRRRRANELPVKLVFPGDNRTTGRSSERKLFRINAACCATVLFAKKSDSEMNNRQLLA